MYFPRLIRRAGSASDDAARFCGGSAETAGVFSGVDMSVSPRSRLKPTVDLGRCHESNWALITFREKWKSLSDVPRSSEMGGH